MGHRASEMLRLIVIDAHDLHHHPGTGIVRTEVHPAAGTSTV